MMKPSHGLLSDSHLLSQTKGLIFDCDGTLADTMPLHYLAWRKTMSTLGIEFNEDYFYSLAGTPTVKIVQRLLREHGIAQACVDTIDKGAQKREATDCEVRLIVNQPLDAREIAHQKELAFLEYLSDVQPIEPVVEIAKRCSQTHAMGVGSGSSRRVVEQILEQIGLGGHFSVVVTAEDTQRHKPEPDVFLEVARRMNVPAERCCVFEDADLGIEAAQRGGMHYFDIRTIFTPRRITETL